MDVAAHTQLPLLSLKQFLIGGLLGCLIGSLIGFFNVIILLTVFPNLSINPQFTEPALLGLCGMIAGAIQGGFVRHATQPALLWLLLSGVGWSITGFLDSQGIMPRPGNALLTIPLMSVLIALPQWLLLRRSLRFAALWLPLSASTWTILVFILRWQSDLIEKIVGWLINHLLI